MKSQNEWEKFFGKPQHGKDRAKRLKELNKRMEELRKDPEFMKFIKAFHEYHTS